MAYEWVPQEPATRAPAPPSGTMRPCPERGARIGERECTTCGNRKTKLHVFACPHHPLGVTYRDCANCKLAVVAPPADAGQQLRFPATPSSAPGPDALILACSLRGTLEPFRAGLAALGYEVTVIQRHGNPSWRTEALAFIAARPPAVVITWQRLYASRAVLDALRTAGSMILFLDFGPAHTDHYGTVIADPAGENAASSVPGALDEALRLDSESARINAHLPGVSGMAAQLRALAAQADADPRMAFLRALPAGFNLFCGQRDRDAVLRFDAQPARRTMAGVAKKLIAEAERQNKFIVLKLHPQGKALNLPESGPHHRIVPQLWFGADNSKVLAWLLVHCGVLTVINSTVAYQGMALGKPVSTLGRGWFSANRVANECVTIDRAFAPKASDAARQAKFVAWLRSRTAPLAAVNAVWLKDTISRYQGVAFRLNHVATVTPIYVRDERSAAVTSECLDALARELPDAERFAAIDLAPPATIELARDLGFRILNLDSGAPPRLNLLYGLAARTAVRPLLMTVESDVVLPAGSAGRIAAALPAFEAAGVAAIEAVTTDADGRINYPSHDRVPGRMAPWPRRKGFGRDLMYPTFSATIWRRDLLARAPWASFAALVRCDENLWRHLGREGWTALIATDLRVRHEAHVARDAAKHQDRPAAATVRPIPFDGVSKMHASSWTEMKLVLDKHLGHRHGLALKVLDVGSMSVNANYPHTYREHMDPAWTYVGCDIAAGKNVDLVQFSPYRIQDAPGEYDVGISGQCLEHVEYPWLLAQEMARMLRRRGLLILTAPWQYKVHRYPLDCWRLLPDGMAALLRYAGLRVIETYIRETDCWGVGVMPT